MWYVIQTVSRQERRIKELLERSAVMKVIDEIAIPKAEFMRKRKGEWVRQKDLLLPGYLLLNTRRPERVAEALTKIGAFARILGNDDKFTPLIPQEVSLLERFTDNGHELVEMSEGLIEGDRVRIISGPLIGLESAIKKIDRHKRCAYLDMKLLGRTNEVRVGLEVVEKR